MTFWQKEDTELMRFMLVIIIEYLLFTGEYLNYFLVSN